jgi:ABC-type spermidine/putrescine transport system permease subunit II
MRSNAAWPKSIVVVAMRVYLMIPLLATLLYSIANQWQTTVLPESWTFIVNPLELMEAAELLGADTWTAFRLIILPAILPGVSVSTLLSLSVLFGEFVHLQLAGRGPVRYELLSALWMRLSKRLFGTDGGNGK